MSVIDKIMELEAQKQALLGEAKGELVTQAEKAIADLNNLGFNFRLIEGSATSTSTTSPGGRRTGVAQDVLALVKSAPNGLPRAAILEQMGAVEKKAQQSISNALSNLKKKGELTAENGVYKAA